MLNIDGHRIAFRAGNPHATGTPIIFVHGIAGSVDFWLPLLPPEVRARRRWYSVSLPGHYPSVLPRGYAVADINAEMFSSVLGGAIRALVPDQPVGIIGYSAGAFAALNLAAQEPDLVTAILSISGFFEARLHGLRGLVQAALFRGKTSRAIVAACFQTVAGSTWLYKRATLANAAQKVHSRTPSIAEVLDVVARDARNLDSRAVIDVCTGLSRSNIFPKLADIQAATMMVAGDRDLIVSYEQSQQMAAAIPLCELRKFHGVGHVFYAECRAAYERVCEDWLKHFCPAARPAIVDSATFSRHAAPVDRLSASTVW